MNGSGRAVAARTLGGVLRRCAPEIAGVGHLLPRRLREPEARERIAHLRKTVDENVVVEGLERRHGVLALPLLRQQRGIVHHVPQTQHETGSSRPQVLERAQYLSAQAKWFLVDDEDVGREHFGCVPNDGGTHSQHLPDVHVQAERGILAASQLDDTGDADEVDPGAKVEAPDDRRSRQDEHGQRLAPRDEVVRDGPATAQVTKPEGIVAVHQHSVVSG